MPSCYEANNILMLHRQLAALALLSLVSCGATASHHVLATHGIATASGPAAETRVFSYGTVRLEDTPEIVAIGVIPYEFSVGSSPKSILPRIQTLGEELGADVVMIYEPVTSPMRRSGQGYTFQIGDEAFSPPVVFSTHASGLALAFKTPAAALGFEIKGGANVVDLVRSESATAAGLAENDRLVTIGSHAVDVDFTRPEAASWRFGLRPGDPFEVVWMDSEGEQRTATLVAGVNEPIHLDHPAAYRPE